jgi:hypothetical protein
MLWGTPVSRSTLRLGEQLVLVVDGGTPDVEYALFDVGDIQLQATEPGTIREMGYTTFAGEARARLADLGVTQELADEVAAAARVPAAKYARGAAVRCIVADLGAVELFEGGTFEPASGHYTGTWLELPTLAGDLNMPEAAATMQALHLAALLAECPDDEPLVLSTAEVTMLRRPGERTHKRVSLGNVEHLAQAIAELKPTSERQRSDKGPGRREILERLRARPHASQRSLDRVAAVEAALSALQAPTAGPLADPEIWNIELKLCRGDASHASAQLDALEQRRGRLPATAYLRARAALIARSEDPRAVAERVSALSTSMPTFHELELLAAEAWAAAGDTRRASAFARDVLENATATDSVRIRAHEVLASGGSPSIRRSVPPAEPTTVTDPRSKRSPSVPPMPTAPRIPKATMPSRTEMGTASPPYRVEPLGERHWSAPPPRAVETEIGETLGMPPGAHGEGSAHHVHAACPRAGARSAAPARHRAAIRSRRPGDRTTLPARGGHGRPDPWGRRARRAAARGFPQRASGAPARSALGRPRRGRPSALGDGRPLGVASGRDRSHLAVRPDRALRGHGPQGTGSGQLLSRGRGPIPLAPE